MANNEVFVPLEPWFYQSPELLRVGRKVDIGLLAEAMIFYDRVYFGFSNDEQFARVVSWFKSQGRTTDLISLLSEGTLSPYYYAFYTLASEVDGVWGVINVQDEEAAASKVFYTRIAESNRVASLVQKRSLLRELINATMHHHVEVKADNFGPALSNAVSDYRDAERAAFLLQIVVDELYRDLGYISPPKIEAIVREEGPLTTITYNFDFTQFAKKLGPSMQFHLGMPLVGASLGVKTLWSAAQLKSDLYVGNPLQQYVNYKLAEGNKAARSRAIIDQLVAEVDFPDIRDLVNRGAIGVRHVLELRAHAKNFRDWLRNESEFDRNAVIAYLNELAQKSGWRKSFRTAISLTGLFGGAAVAALISDKIGLQAGIAAGAASGKAAEYVIELATKVDEGWRPKVFGQVAQSIIARAQLDHQS